MSGWCPVKNTRLRSRLPRICSPLVISGKASIASSVIFRALYEMEPRSLSAALVERLGFRESPNRTPRGRRPRLQKRRDGGPGAVQFLALNELQQVGVDGFGFGGGHAVRKAFVGFESGVLQQLRGQRACGDIRNDLVVFAVH